MQKEKAKSKRGIPFKKLSSANRHRIPTDRPKQIRDIHRKAKSSTTSTDTIYSITFKNKSQLDVCENLCTNDYIHSGKDINIQDHLVEIINDIFPECKTELKNLTIFQETPGYILDAIIGRLQDKYPKYELYLVKEEKWIIRQKISVGIDFSHLPIDELIAHCDSN